MKDVVGEGGGGCVGERGGDGVGVLGTGGVCGGGRSGRGCGRIWVGGGVVSGAEDSLGCGRIFLDRRVVEGSEVMQGLWSDLGGQEGCLLVTSDAADELVCVGLGGCGVVRYQSCVVLSLCCS